MSIFGNVSAAGGFDQSEIDFVTQLISSGQTTIDEVSKTFGVPTDVIILIGLIETYKSALTNNLLIDEED